MSLSKSPRSQHTHRKTNVDAFYFLFMKPKHQHPNPGISKCDGLKQEHDLQWGDAFISPAPRPEDSREFWNSCCDLPQDESNKNPTDWICSSCKSKEQALSKITKKDLQVLERAIVASIDASFADTNAKIIKLQSCLVDCIRHNDELFLKIRSMQHDLNYMKLKVDDISDARLSSPGSRRSSDASDKEGKHRKWYYAVVPIIYKLKDSEVVRKILKELAKLSFIAIHWVLPRSDKTLEFEKRPRIRCKGFASIKSNSGKSKQDDPA
ncbi:hypothetical protein GE061_012079 [Apolygus lucorum]|uniref:Uncharacterized protein n=1 Tax=Apolygus lucorum TaxID=248454 RepID=A0A8S9XTY8_APOLU|nr:hypothetical protein GE061_012079 [Apolygus lucorum]